LISSRFNRNRQDVVLPGPKVQTLEDLRQSPNPAWLWDGARGRIVWANAAGITAFDGQSLLDLVDRPFDLKETGVERIAELTQSLKRGESQTALLHFPSTGQVVPMDCLCSLHALADGRSGVLVISRPTALDLASDTGGLFASIFAELPMATILVSETGAILRANAMASELFDASDLGGLLGNTAHAEQLLQRLQHTSLVSRVESISGRFGTREARMNLRRLSNTEKAFAIAVFDDITERRAIERQLAGEAQPAPVSNDAQAFENLGRTLKAALRRDDPAVKSLVVVKAPAPEVFVIPKTIRDALEQTGAAIVIAQNGTAAFASSKAAELMGHESSEALLSNTDFWRNLSEIKESCAETSLVNAAGQNLPLQIEISSIPWVNGPAKQYLLTQRVVAEIPLPVAKPAIVVVPKLETPSAPDDELRQILDIASDGIATLDGSGNIRSFSAGAEAIFGYRLAEVVGRPLVDLMAEDSRKSLRNYLSGLNGPGLAAVFNDGREMNAIVKQGGTVPLFLTIGRLQSSQSNAEFCAVLRDITTWKRTEKELREAKESAEEASRQKSDFLARISHELRTPLNAIIGFSEVMRMGQFGEIKNDKYRGYVNDIHASGGHLLSLINDLLDLSKIEAGKMELNFTAVSVTDVTDHATRLLQEVATRGRVLVRKSIPDKLPRVVADLRAMRQVMLNLLSNAIKYTDPGGQVIVSAHVSKNGELSLRLKDTGVGMNATEIQDALEPFKRVETPGRETLGTGLGLPLTKALVEANRAKFEISSEPGQGTLVEITFPTTRVLAE
jgi:PAS domain S-box-containing protein